MRSSLHHLCASLLCCSSGLPAMSVEPRGVTATQPTNITTSSAASHLRPDALADALASCVHRGDLSEQDCGRLFTVLYRRLNPGDLLQHYGSMQSHIDDTTNDGDTIASWAQPLAIWLSRPSWRESDSVEIVDRLGLDEARADAIDAALNVHCERRSELVIDLIAHVEAIRIKRESAVARQHLARISESIDPEDAAAIEQVIKASEASLLDAVRRRVWPVESWNPGAQAAETFRAFETSKAHLGGGDPLARSLFNALFDAEEAGDTIDRDFEATIIMVVDTLPEGDVRSQLGRVRLNKRMATNTIDCAYEDVQRALKLAIDTHPDMASSNGVITATALIEDAAPTMVRLLDQRDEALRQRSRACRRFVLLSRTESTHKQMVDAADRAIKACTELRDELRRQFDAVVELLEAHSTTHAEYFRTACDRIAFPRFDGPENIKEYANRLASLDTTSDQQRAGLAELLPRLTADSTERRRESGLQYIQLLETASREYVNLPGSDVEAHAKFNARADSIFLAHGERMAELFSEISELFSVEQVDEVRDRHFGFLDGRTIRPDSPSDRARKIWRRAIRQNK